MSESIKCLFPRGLRHRRPASSRAFHAAVLAVLLSLPAAAAERPATPPWQALPTAESYDPTVPTPAEVLGFEIGSRHVRHDELVDYMRRLAAASDRVEIEEQGRTHEGRPQLLLTISTPGNLARREEIRRRHLALSEPPWEVRDDELDTMPVVVWLGYSIHGDEASGANASLLVAYYLAAARGVEIERLLERSVVLVDPSLNPDGLARFAHWVEVHRGRVEVDDPLHREHLQGWPSARTNHYWFDLNRDWLLLQHPESRARVATLQRWRPNLLADFHEMGTDSSFFFQPGVPSRQNPLTPERNLELTREIARFHADAFDRAGQLYFSEELFDDFYYGKGSTYPDVQGAVGILFEQASSRGIRQRRGPGVLTFAETVANQVRASFSTLAAAQAKRHDLLAWQRDFYRQTTAAAAAGPVGGWIVGSGGDPARAGELVSILDAHGITVHRLAQNTTAEGRSFAAGEALVVPAAQRQARLAEALFERRTEFADQVFYDVSAWTLPLAFGLPWAEVPRGRWSPALVGEPVGAADVELPAGRVPAAGASYAWVFDWQPRWAPRALQRLLDAGVEVRVATRPFRAVTDAGSRSFGFGAVIVPAAQEASPQVIGEAITELTREDGVDVWALSSGRTVEGVDLGSPSLRRVTSPRALLVVGNHVVQYAAGEVWHLLDHRYGLPLSLVDRHRLGSVDLADYTHVLLVDGRYSDLPEEAVAALAAFLRGGGVVVATQGAAHWAGQALAGEGTDGAPAAGTASRQGTTAAVDPPSTADEESSDAEGGPAPRVAYADYEARRAVDLIGGAIFEVELDVTHPLAYGYAEPRLAVFRDGSRVLEPSDNPYENVALYTPSPLLAGYASADNVERIAGSAGLVASRVGRGLLVRFADDPAFRGYWAGTHKLLINTLYFGPLVRPTPLPDR